MHVYTLSDMRSEKKLRVYTASEAKGLNAHKLYKQNRLVVVLLLVTSCVFFHDYEYREMYLIEYDNYEYQL